MNTHLCCELSKRSLKWGTYAAGLVAVLASTVAQAAPPDVLTQRYDNGRNGRAVDSTITPQLLSSGNFQKIGELPVSGAIYAQPLFVQNQVIANGTVHDLVVVATSTNILYAFDANNYQQLWTTGALGTPDKSISTADPSYGCSDMNPMFVSTTTKQTFGIGIQSTPVIDRTAGTAGVIYVTYRTNPGTNPASSKQWLARIDLRSGAVLTTKEVTTTDLGQSPVALRVRASLLLTGRVLYVAFGSLCETIALPGADEYNSMFFYRGSVLAIDPISLNKVGRYDTMLPNQTLPSNGLPFGGGGIWQASTGLASDDAGNLFFTTGNSLIMQTNSVDDSSNTSANNVQNSFVRLAPTVTPATGQVTSVTFPSGAADWFTPYRSEWHNRADMDLGSAGVILPPGTSEVVGGGKEGIVYVLNRSNMGHYSSTHWTPSVVHNTGNFWNPNCITKAPFEDLEQLTNMCDSNCYVVDSGNDPVVQKISLASNIDCGTPNMGNWIGWAHIHGTPAFGRAGDGNDYLYTWAEKDQIVAYRRVGGSTPYQTTGIRGVATTPNGGMPGGMLTLSSTPTNTSTVVFAALPLEAVNHYDLFFPDWSSTNVNAGGLIAFDGTPSDVPNAPAGTKQLKMLWGDFASDSVPYVHSKFVPPTVAKGKVFLATFSNRVNVYGSKPNPVATSVTNVTGILQNSSRATAVSVDPTGTLAVFGHLNTQTGDWPARLATLGSANMFPPNAGVALAIHNSNLLAFAVDTNGLLRMFSTPTSGGATSWTGPTTVSSVAMPAGAQLTTGRRGTELGVYMIDGAGDIHLFRSAAATPWPDQKLPVATTKFVPGAGIAADYQTSTQLDVFAVNTAGVPRVYWSSTTPNASWFSSSISGVTLMPGARLATGKRGSNEFDLFAIGGPNVTARPSATCTSGDPNGDTGCLKRMWVTGLGSWNVETLRRELVPDWAQFLGSYPPGVPGSAIATAKQGADQLNVMFVSTTGSVVIYFSQNTDEWWTVTMSGPSTNSGVNWSTLRAAPGSSIAAFPSKLSLDGAPSKLDVLVPGTRTQPAGTSGIFGSSVTVGDSTWSFPFRAL